MPLGISARFHCDLELRGVVVFHLAVNEVPAPKHLLHDLIIKVSYVGIGEIKTTGFFVSSLWEKMLFGCSYPKAAAAENNELLSVSALVAESTLTKRNYQLRPGSHVNSAYSTCPSVTSFSSYLINYLLT